MPTYVMRQGAIVDKDTGEPMKTPVYHGAFPRPYAISDIKPYASPITGEIIDGRAARREDLKKHGCVEAGDMPRRPYVHSEKYAKITGLPLKGRDV